MTRSLKSSQLRSRSIQTSDSEGDTCVFRTPSSPRDTMACMASISCSFGLGPGDAQEDLLFWALSPMCPLEAKSTNRMAEHHWLARLNLPVCGHVRQRPST